MALAKAHHLASGTTRAWVTMSHTLGIHSGAAAPTQGLRASRRVSLARATHGLQVTAQAANSPHNHRAVSPSKPRPGSVLAQPKTVTQSDAAAKATATGTTSALSASGSDQSARGRSSVTFSNAAVNSAGFQRTSWYGAVDNRSAVGTSSLVQDGAITPGRRNLRAIRPITRKAGGSSAGADQGSSTPAANPKIPPPAAKPTAEASPAGELRLPRESATGDVKPARDAAEAHGEVDPKKKSSLTRLLRTPLSGGVLNSMKDADLPSVAVAARNLMELADYADLSTIMSNMNHRRTGYPFASTVDFATDADGFPIFCLTPLAMHTRNLAYNSRASLTVKMNGWGGLANARVTIFGDVHRLPDEYQGAANEVFKAKYEARKEEVDLEDRWGDYTFYRMNNIIDVYFVGGFGTLNWVNLDEYKNAKPDNIVTPSEGSSVLDTLAELNTRYGVKLATSGAVDDSIGPNESVLSEKAKVDDVWIISIDKRGVDVRVRVDGLSQVRRLQFQGCVETFNDACDAIEALIAGTVWGGGPCEDD